MEMKYFLQYTYINNINKCNLQDLKVILEELQLIYFQNLIFKNNGIIFQNNLKKNLMNYDLLIIIYTKIE